VTNTDYFNKMSKQDISARNAINIPQYIESYINAYETFTNYERNAIFELVSEANNKLKPSFTNVYTIPWKFCKLNIMIENGLPHTLGDTIIISSNLFSLPYLKALKTLIHEKVHVYQRYNKGKCEELYQLWGFVKYDYGVLLQGTRNNPDISSSIYGTKEGPIVQIYTKQIPSSLLDSQASLIQKSTNMVIFIDAEYLGFPSYIKQVEHPNEIMACMVPELVFEIEPSTEKEYTLLNWIRTN
jgi:hypothetical protein